jgi:regulator of cell morphogenesis and NO signaling
MSPTPTPEPRRRSRAEEAVAAWRQRSLPELLDHLEEHYHRRVRQALPAIEDLLERCRQSGAVNASALTAVKGLFDDLVAEIRQHLEAEEEELFPALREAADEPELPAELVARLEAEHDEMSELLVEKQLPVVEALLPEAELEPLQELHRRLKEFEGEMREHVALERELLFTHVPRHGVQGRSNG